MSLLYAWRYKDRAVMYSGSTPRKMWPSVVAFGIAQIIGWGFTFNLPGVIGTSIADSLDTTLDVILLGPTVMLTILAFMSWWMVPLFERFGARNLMIIGAVIIAVALLVMVGAPNVPVFISAWILFGFGGAASLSTAAQIALADIFQDRGRQAISAMSLISGLSNTVLWPVISRADNAFGWRPTAFAGALALLLVYIPLVSRFGVSKSQVQGSHAMRETGHTHRLDPLRFALVAGITALNGFITWGFSLTLIPLLMEKGLDESRAVMLASLLGLISIAARSVDVIGKWSPVRSATTSTATMFLAFVLLYFGGSFMVAVTFILLYGLSAGLMSVVRATLPLTMFPAEAYARAAGRLAMPLNLSFAVAPPVFARILDGPGANTALVLSITLSAAAMVCLIGLIMLIRRQE